MQITASSPGYEVRRDESYYKKGDSFTIDIASKKSQASPYVPYELDRSNNKPSLKTQIGDSTSGKQNKSTINKYSGRKITIDFD